MWPALSRAAHPRRGSLTLPSPALCPQPSPMDQMSQGLAFNFSYFYRGHHVRPELLQRALAGLLGELPQLAGRGAVQGRGARMADAVVDCGNQGAELATSVAPGVRWAARNGRRLWGPHRLLGWGRVDPPANTPHKPLPWPALLPCPAACATWAPTAGRP